MKDTVQKPGRVSMLYAFVVLLASFLFHTFFPVRYHHRERAKLKAPYIVIGNHLSMFDPVIVGYGCRRYQIRFLGKAELTKTPILRFLFSRIQMISVSRYNTDMKALRACLKVLKDGHVLGIFPEGTRYKQGIMEEMEGGVAMIALQSNVMVLPAYIDGKLKLFHRTNCYFGEAFSVEDIKAKGINKETEDEVLARIRGIYENLVLENAQTPKK
jgi:1-acyl-sn-glycerol-3-phosphate acyltransferase